jgi:glutathione peroxidase-family protein
VLQTSTPKEREAAAYDEVVVVVDNVISHCGFRPDTSLTQELQVDAHG